LNRISDKQLGERLLEGLEAAGPAGLSIRQLLRRLGLPPEQRRRVRRLLQRLVASGQVSNNRRGRYARANREFFAEGLVRARGRGWLELAGNGNGSTVGIAPENKGGAMPGDRVRVKLLDADRSGGGRGRVEEILQRGRQQIVGTLHRGGRFVLLVPDDGRLDPLIVRRSSTRDIDDGTVVAVRPDSGNPLQAQVAQVLGQPGVLDTELRRLQIASGLTDDFPAAAEDEVSALGELAGPEAGRADLRKLEHVTIDPDDARDFDDAIFVEKQGDGYRLLVSIADVARYVPAGSAVDQEARRRGCSTYLPGHVYPMLPHRLSEQLCSLAPGRPRPAVSVEMEVGDDGRVRSARLRRSLIRSAARLTYRQVQRVLDGHKQGVAAGQVTMLRAANACARALLAHRKRLGMLDLEVPELQVVVNEQGWPKLIKPAERFFAHRLIEVFMVTANEQVATLMRDSGVPALYRVHPPPDADKLQAFTEVARELGAPAAFSGDVTPTEIAGYLRSLEDSPLRQVLHSLLLRSLMQAFYAAECRPHFGLASSAYLHFTSPIRRYPDLLVHRQLTRLLERAGSQGIAVGRKLQIPVAAEAEELEDLEALAEQCSRSERRALAAERQAQALYGAAYLQQHVGEQFTGRISFPTEFGLFVTLEPSGIEGLLHIAAMRDDYYRFVPERLALVGRRSRKSYLAGQKVQVRLEAVRLFPPQLELVFAGNARDRRQSP